MRLKHYAPIAFILLTAWPAFAQDLSLLQDRAMKLWELRKQANKLDALQLIDPQTRQTYLQGNEPPIISFKVTGLEFTDDRNRIVVVSKVRQVLPQIGEMDVPVREPWIWKDKKWSMQALPPSTPFSKRDSTDTPTDDRVPPKLEMSSTTIDLGQHTQGDIIAGKIPFFSNRDEIRKIELGQAVPGLAMRPPVWTNEKEGYLLVQWDTTLVWQDVNQTVPLEVLGTNDTRASIDVRIQAHINGKVGFKQVPEIIDTANDPAMFLRKISDARKRSVFKLKTHPRGVDLMPNAHDGMHDLIQ